MSYRLPPAEAGPKGQTVAPAGPREDRVALMRTWVREAVDESGWKHAAVAAHLGDRLKMPALKGVHGAAYWSKLLRGEKGPITQDMIEALPDEIEVIYAAKHASHLNLVVIAADVARSFSQMAHGVGGLMDRLSNIQPRPVKASLPVESYGVDRRVRA